MFEVIYFLHVPPPEHCRHISSLHACHMLCSSHRRCFDHPSGIRWEVQIKKVLVMHFVLPSSQAQIYFSSLCSQAILAYMISLMWDARFIPS
jgi:hypothetical protein